MSITEVTQIVGAVGVVLSLSILSWQSRQLVKQIKIGNSMATLTAMNNGLDRLHSFLGRLVDDPTMRPYFYEGRDIDGVDETTKQKVTAIAEMLADILDYGLTAAEYLPQVKEQDDWSDFTIYCLEHSPVFRHLIEESPDEWWKEIARLQAAHGALRPVAPSHRQERPPRRRRRFGR